MQLNRCQSEGGVNQLEFINILGGKILHLVMVTDNGDS